ncbi:MotA/TolQ/ExbB proton channel family protein [Winogradskyella thalassocola]|uniref:Uncharacterized protein n=1 Tax=Winogradskyella thalassocola TaxID=262004 RepID=A0A1G8B991_9FLAO|nr:MotA/TolQ/ExbB proton channel family protein [Winogradskyella thalassocola]SDH29767.1 hypothetical protein SAMN04489796_102192 [Winogradskyella thalassocola]
MSNKITISLIEISGQVSSSFHNTISAINSYLLRNKGAISDFNLIKDIVDRNIDNEESAITSNLPIPLYLGLFGTMLGIIIGLIAMPSLSDSISGSAESMNADNTLKGVDALLIGVKIAMIASAIGLLLTTINSLLFYNIRKGAENDKNNFFTFIQTQLLPILSKNTASSLQTLQANLLKFNEGFAINMGHFDGVIKEVRSSFESQLQVVEELKRIDVGNMARYNINVMKEINSSFSKLKELSEYLANVNGLLKNTERLNHTVSIQLDKVGDLGTIIDNFDVNAKNISEGSKYLQTHFSSFEQREQAISNKVADFDSSTGDMVEELKKSFEQRMKSFNEKDVEINSGFEKLFKDLKDKTKQVFDDESQNIAAIKQDVLKVNDSISQIKSLPNEVGVLKASIKDHDTTINQLMDKIADKPLYFKTPKLLLFALIFTSIVIMATCGLFIYKYIL